MKVFSKVGAAVVALACAGPLVTAGCGSDFGGEQGQPVEKTGTLKTALSTVGSDGATYTFVTGTAINLSTGTWVDSYPFDGPETVFTKTLGVGSYSLDLVFGAYPAPVLVRTTATETKNVNAIWTDTHPVPFDITNATTTNVVLHFSVPGVADVTFDTGQVSVTAEVTKNDSATPGIIVNFANVAVSTVTFADPTAPYASFFADTIGATRFFGLGFTPTGPWAALGDAACIPVTVTSVSSDPAPDATAFNERMLQFILGTTGTGDVCIHDDGADDLLEVRLRAEGAVPASQTMVLPSAPYLRTLYVSGRIGDVFDGVTLQQTLLEKQVSVTSGIFDHRIAKDSSLLTTLRGNVSNGGLRADPPTGP
jgi:hypothetical protein